MHWLAKQEFEHFPSVDSAIEQLLEQWLLPCAENGWIQLARIKDSRCFMNVLPVQEKQELVINDDMEILLPSYASLRLRWKIEQFSELVQEDQWTRYRLTIKSVHKALENGMSGEEIIGCLKQASGDCVPVHIFASLQQWIQSFGQIVVQNAVSLQCSEKEIADILEATLGLNTHMLRRLNETEFLVQPNAEHVSALLSKLQQEGYAPLDRRQATESTALKAGQHRKGRLENQNHLGLIALKQPDFQHDHEGLEIQALYPGLDSIPRMWMEELRSYHESTRKAIVQKAIAYQAWLKVKRNSNVQYIAPEKIEESYSSWYIHAKSQNGKLVLPKEDCQHLQLILPGINDTTEVIPYP